jgi:hypothetical protein
MSNVVAGNPFCKEHNYRSYVLSHVKNLTYLDYRRVKSEHVQQAMEKQMRAERDRRAQILSAEGSKGAAVLEAEGIREAAVNTAEGERQAAILRADGEAKAMERMAQAQEIGRASCRDRV